MGTTITGNRIFSDRTKHYAAKIPALPPGELWRVSWLPTRVLSRNQAITAMVIAEHVAMGIRGASDPKWPFMDAWAAELDVTGPDAVARASEPPDLSADDEFPHDCPCGPAKHCPFPRDPARDAKPFAKFTSRDWTGFHHRAAHYFRASIDVHRAAGDVTAEMLDKWRIAADLHLCVALAEHAGTGPQ